MRRKVFTLTDTPPEVDRLGSPRYAPAGIAALVLSVGCGGDEETVSFKSDIRPLLQARCVVCHDENNDLSLTHPFDPDRGLFVVENTWFEGHGGLQYNVVPFDPESSFLIQKVSDRALIYDGVCNPFSEEEDCINAHRGIFMPPNPPRITQDQSAIVRRWIADGAGDTLDFREGVVPIFGKWWSFNPRSCGQAGYANFCVPCTDCHRPDGPATPDLRVPNFEAAGVDATEIDLAVAEWLATVVGVKSSFRSDLDLVAPGNPDDSFLLMKMEAQEPSSFVGAPMPLGFEPLSEAQVAMLRQWILEGARNN